MIQNQIARKYSQALFMLAEEENKFADFRRELNEIWETISGHEELKNLLFHPRIAIGEKKRVFKRIFFEEISRDIFNFLNLLIDKRRIFYIGSIIEKFNDLVNNLEDILEIKVISAVELDQDLKDRLKNKLEEKLGYEVVLEHNIDPDIIGGLILQIGDHIIDGSIQNELNSLRERIEQIPVSKLGVE